MRRNQAAAAAAAIARAITPTAAVSAANQGSITIKEEKA